MRRPKFTRHLTAAVATTAMFGAVLAGPVAAEENRVPAPGDSGTTSFDMNDALRQLRSTVSGNPAAEAAVDRLLAERPQVPGAAEVALPAQVFQIPANSDIGRTGASPGVHGSGVALGINGFQFGYFGGPGTIAPNQDGAKLEVAWLNLSNGRSGFEVLNQHLDIPVDTSIRSRSFDPGGGLIVAAAYGTLWHRWPAPVDEAHPDGFHYQRATIDFPSLGAVYN
ncbi:hypothetical protein [Nocardia shimofusensis]|uniref:hypothetical protein n=1 Tax=Nocardia shimofusensis TaxID=228596 RepID=UPI0008315F54|nr:hypothetical protein [Nocardia shimofusensis]